MYIAWQFVISIKACAYNNWPVLYCSYETESSFRILYDEADRSQRNRPQSHDESASSQPDTAGSSDQQTTSADHFNSSPYPHIDAFITSQLCREGVQGSIQKWTFFNQGTCRNRTATIPHSVLTCDDVSGKVIVYDIKDYRWCENIGRHHKTSNITLAHHYYN